MRKLLPGALATLSGVLYFLGFIGFDQWYLSWVCLVPLLLALRGVQTGWRALGLSWWMGFVTHLGGYYWLVHMLQEFAYFSIPLAMLGYLLLCVVQGAIFGAFGWLAWLLQRRTRLPLGLVAPVAYVALEFAFPLIFPSYLANSQAWVPLLTQVADLGGVLLLSGLMALVNAALAEVIAARLERRPLPRAFALAGALTLAFTAGYGALRLRQMAAVEQASPKLKVAVVQANVGESDKHLHVAEGIQRFKDMTDEAMKIPGLGLILWPESGFNRYVPSGADLSGLVASQVTVPMIIGAMRMERDSSRNKIWNSAFVVAPGGKAVANYDKTKLLVFGEYLPFEKLLGPLYRKLLPFAFSQQFGESLAPLPVGPYQVSADICYEDILPRHIRDLMGPLDGSGARPHAMVNLTNDSWYGPVEPRIHLALATFRAIEHRRWLVRSTATGISAFIDASGRIVQSSNFEKAETLVGEVPMIEGGATVYGLIGDSLGWLALAASTAGLFWRRKAAADAKAKGDQRQAA